MRYLTNTSKVLCIVGLACQSFLFAEEGDAYSWPKYNPTLDYNFKDEFPDLKEPTKDLDDCNEVGTLSDGWWTFKWGSNKNSLVTEAAITPLLARMNKDFAYFRDVMGWPPDKRAKEGYRSAIYLYGSGLCTDNEPNTALGGWQSAIGSYPMVLLSYYPVYSFDPQCTYADKESQMGACVHEGIHSVLADLPGCKKAAWFQEGGNTWLQQQAYAQQSNEYKDMGFLNGTSFLAPFMPIECYSGWLQDGSFGGPSAEGVDMYNEGKQTCTWRRFLGGHQYGNIFPTFLGEWLGLGSVPWIWKNCPGRVLEGMAKTLGDQQIRRLIIEYRAKLALIDMKKWTDACKAVLDPQFGTNIGPEWEPYWIDCDSWKATPYVKTTNTDGVLVPEERTLPGWSGANQIPLTVDGNMVKVDFQPIDSNMSCVLCYRATDGSPVYSAPVTSGECSLRLDKPASNNVVIAVIVNTNYIYEGENTRKKHFDYRLKLVDGISGTADIYKKWYDVKMISTATEFPIAKNAAIPKTTKFKVSYNKAMLLSLEYYLEKSQDITVNLYTISGKVIKTISNGFKHAGYHNEHINIGKNIPSGLYIVKMSSNTNNISTSFIVN